MYEYVRNSLWIVPLAFVVLAGAMALALPAVDEGTRTTIGIDFGEDAARSVLGAIASGMITFTGFVFSILLLAVQFGSSQFSPRLLRRFLRDPSTKVALGIFMATFIYALGVLRVVGTGENAAFVPNNSIAVAILLLLLSMLMFLRLLSRTTQSLRVASVLAELGTDARGVVDRVYPKPFDQREPTDPGPPSGEGRAVTYHGAPGIVQSVDVPNLVERARQSDAVISLEPRLGELVADGSPLFTVHGGRTLIDDSSVPETRRPAVEAELALLDAAARRVFGDSTDRLAAVTSDRQGLGATEIPDSRLPQQREAVGPEAHAESPPPSVSARDRNRP